MNLRSLLLCTFGLLVAAPLVLAQKSWEPPRYDGRRECLQQGATTFCLPLDATWQVVQFAGDTNCNGAAVPGDLCQRNDDDHTVAVPLGFTFDLYGTPQTTVYINNNGNLSFGGGYCDYTAAGFPVNGFPMVAPFWADVDTRSGTANDGVVWMKQGPNYLAVAWDHVGYFNIHPELKNTFQVIISDRTFAPMGLGNNVCFCYGDMQWTTGDASGGVGGFGGTPATVGVNKGDGINFFQIGRFDHAGTDYDGPGGNPDGVDFLDNFHSCFNVGAEFNQPPLPINFPPDDQICVAVGQTLNLSVGFIGPEASQTVHTVVNSFGLANFTYTSTDGNPSTVDMTFTPSVGQVGNHTIHFTATDDFNPPGVTEIDLILCVQLPTPTSPGTWGQVKALFR
jgi:hypothetical protein